MTSNSNKIKEIIYNSYSADLTIQVNELNNFISKNGIDGNFRHTGFFYKDKIRPIYFTGNPELLDSSDFILLISLNPKFSESDLHKNEYDIRNKSFDDYFLYLSNYFHESNTLYYKPFWNPLGRLISSITDTANEDYRNCLFKTCFSIELIPFYSENWSIGKINLRELYELNCMYYIKQIRHLLFNQCKPSMILANGNDIVHACDIFLSNPITRHIQFEGGKKSWIKQGSINDIPFFGFPFLRKPNSANSNNEIIELGGIIRRHIEE